MKVLSVHFHNPDKGNYSEGYFFTVGSPAFDPNVQQDYWSSGTHMGVYETEEQAKTALHSFMAQYLSRHNEYVAHIDHHLAEPNDHYYRFSGPNDHCVEQYKLLNGQLVPVEFIPY